MWIPVCYVQRAAPWGSLTAFKQRALLLTMTLNTFSQKTVMQDMFVPEVSFSEQHQKVTKFYRHLGALVKENRVE